MLNNIINVEYIGPAILKKTISINNVNNLIDLEEIENMARYENGNRVDMGRKNHPYSKASQLLALSDVLEWT